MVRAAHSEDCFWPWGPGNCTFTQIRFSVVVWVNLEFHSHDTNAPCKLHPLPSNRGTPEGQRCQLPPHPYRLANVNTASGQMLPKGQFLPMCSFPGCQQPGPAQMPWAWDQAQRHSC